METGFDLAWWVWTVIVVAMLAAGTLQGMFGFGFPIIATPMTVLVTDVKTAIVLNMLPTLVLNLASVVRGGNWSRSLGVYWPIALFVVAGSVLGAVAAEAVLARRRDDRDHRRALVEADHLGQVAGRGRRRLGLDARERAHREAVRQLSRRPRRGRLRVHASSSLGNHFNDRPGTLRSAGARRRPAQADRRRLWSA